MITEKEFILIDLISFSFTAIVFDVFGIPF